MLESELSAEVRRRFRAPAHAGAPGPGRRHGSAGAVRQGTLIELWLAVEDGTVREARFLAFGCPSAIAAADWVCEWAEGRPVGEVEGLTGLAVAEALALAAAKRGVALLAEDALKAALCGAPTDQD